MLFSKPLLGTDTNKTKLSWFEYIWFSCLIQGWYNCFYAFHNWGDLMGNNYQGYALLPEDSDLECCIQYFWDSLEDEIYSKTFLEYLMKLSDDAMSGKVEMIPAKDFFDLLDTSETDQQQQNTP